MLPLDLSPPESPTGSFLKKPFLLELLQSGEADNEVVWETGSESESDSSLASEEAQKEEAEEEEAKEEEAEEEIPAVAARPLPQVTCSC